MNDILVITQSGLNAAANANAGGFLIDILQFKIGDSTIAPTTSDTDIKGDILYAGNIAFVEVASEATARFTCDLPAEILGVTTDLSLKEIGLYLDSNVMFARGVFSNPPIKMPGIALRISAIITATNCDLTVINVGIGEFSSIPATAFVRRLPNPALCQHNAIAVLDQADNPVAQYSGSIAIRYGAGNSRWGFIGYDLVYNGNPDGFGITPSTLTIDMLTSHVTFLDNETVIIQVITGPGVGESRRFRYQELNKNFVEAEDSPFTSVSIASVIAVWKKQGGISSTFYGDLLPPRKGIPKDWVLICGDPDPKKPEWAPPYTGGDSITTLYYPPSRLVFKLIYLTGDGKKFDFDLNLTDNMFPENVCYTLVSLQGILQTRQAYEIRGTKIVFSEPPNPGMAIEIWLAYREVSSGNRIKCQTFPFVISATTVYKLVGSDLPLTKENIFVSLGGLKQFNNSYNYDATTNELTFTELPPEGTKMEVTTLTSMTVDGYSSHLHNYDFYSTDTDLTELPLAEVPESKEYIFINVSGIYLHRDNYSLQGNRVILSSFIKKGRPISVTLVKNKIATGTLATNLSGVVVDGLLNVDNLQLIRHNAYPVIIPLPRLIVKGGPGIDVKGEYPYYTISSSLADGLKSSSSSRFSTLHSSEDSEEIMYTYRLHYTESILVQVTADFSARLGPGFMSTNGGEYIEYVIGFRLAGNREPVYGRRIKGSGHGGFSYLTGSEFAYANASLSQIFDFILDNNPSGYVDLIAKMRVKNGRISDYKSLLTINFNSLTLPNFK